MAPYMAAQCIAVGRAQRVTGSGGNASAARVPCVFSLPSFEIVIVSPVPCFAVRPGERVSACPRACFAAAGRGVAPPSFTARASLH